jgi:hypothetical protein
MGVTSYADRRTKLEVIVDRDVKARVLKGIQLLEERYGPDWADHIDLDLLDLSSAQFCVLGQLYNDQIDEDWGDDDYTAGCRILDVQDENYGFTVFGDDSEWEQLDVAWSEEIRKRKERDGEDV